MDPSENVTETPDDEGDTGLVMKIDQQKEAQSNNVGDEDGTVAGVSQMKTGFDEEGDDTRHQVNETETEITAEAEIGCDEEATSEDPVSMIVETPSEHVNEIGEKAPADVEILEVDQDQEASEMEEEPIVFDVEDSCTDEGTFTANIQLNPEDNDSDVMIVEEKTGADLITDEAKQDEGEEILNKPDVFLYRITSESHEVKKKAADWDLQNPFWCGNLYAYVQRSNRVLIKLEDEDGTFGRAYVEEFPSSSLSPVTDSTRFFILRVNRGAEYNEESVGLGFSERTDSADFTSVIQNRVPGLRLLKPGNKGRQANPKKPSASANTKQTETGFIIVECPPGVQQVQNASVASSSSVSHIKPADQDEYLQNGLLTKGMFSCHLCPASFNDMRHIKCHWFKFHKLRNVASCPKCKMPYPTHEQMVKHRIEVHGHQCPDCGMKFKKQPALEQHFVEVHENTLAFSCTLCKLKFPLRHVLRNHVARSHKSEARTVLKKCPQCPKLLLDDDDFREHLTTHQKFVFCHVCNAGFSKKGHVREHMKRYHKGVKSIKF